MKNIYATIALIFLSLLSTISTAETTLPHLFLFIGGDSARMYRDKLANEFVSGAQIIYPWSQLEPKKNVYDFSKIEDDLQFLKGMHKQLYIQIQDRSFDINIYNVPNYIREDHMYHGGVAMQYDVSEDGKPINIGWVARVWDPEVRYRFHLLIEKLATSFDGKIYGVNLPETAASLDLENPPQDFTPDKYFDGELDNMTTLRNAFHKSFIIQYVNFFPNEWNNDHHYTQRLFEYAAQHQIGLGGPDVLPYKLAQMENTYPFFHQYQGKILTGMAIQEPDYLFKNPKTNDYYTFFEFYDFAKNYLGSSIIFWNVQEPFYSDQMVLSDEYFSKSINE